MISLGTVDGLTIYAPYYLRGLTLGTHETCKRILLQILKTTIKCSGHAKIQDFSSGRGDPRQTYKKNSSDSVIFLLFSPQLIQSRESNGYFKENCYSRGGAPVFFQVDPTFSRMGDSIAYTNRNL